MNINKQEMNKLFRYRRDPEKMQKLLKNFYEMGSQLAHHFDIPHAKRDDYIQSAVVLSWQKLDKYKPSKKRSAFSYFYQIIRRDIMDNMRKEKKRNGIAQMISHDDPRNDWIKDIKHFDNNYEVIENKINAEIKMGIKKEMRSMMRGQALQKLEHLDEQA